MPQGIPMYFISAPPFDLHDLHFHAVVAKFGKKAEKTADGRVFQIAVTQHIAPAGYVQTAVPRGKLIFRIRNGKISSHILDLCAFELGLADHLDRRLIGSIKYKNTLRACVRQSKHQCLDLLFQEVIEHTRSKKHGSA